MNVTTIGRGSIGGTLARLWQSAGHQTNSLGRAGGDAAGADVVLLAVPYLAVPDVLESVTGLENKIVLDATNRLNGETPPEGFDSMAEYVKARTHGPVAKVFNLNYGALLESAATTIRRPGNIWVGDEAARPAVETLSADIGMDAVNGGPLDRAGTQEAFGYFLNSIVADTGSLVLYRFATPDDL